MADGHSALLEDHPVNNQPKNLLLDLKGWIDERGANACAECLKSFQEPDCLLTFAALPAEFVKPLAQMSGMVLDLPTAFLQLIQLDRGRLVGIDQPRDLAVQGLELALQARAFALICCATIKTGHPATICHTSDGGAVSGGQADVKPEAASGGSPEGQALQQFVCQTS